MRRMLVLLLALLCFLGACGKTGGDTDPAQTGTTANGTAPPQTTGAPDTDIEINILAQASDEGNANVIRDQLAKAGFKPKVTLQPDYASFRAMVDAGNFDIAITYWTTVTGSPDYAVRAVWHSEGALNLYGINDPELDRLIELGSAQTEEEYRATYDQYETYLVEDMAYIIPLYNAIKTLTVNTDILDPDTMILTKSRSMVWEEMRYQDPSKHDTMDYVMSQTRSSLTPLDPVRSDDVSTFMLNTNSYIRMVNLTADDKITTNSALSRSYAIDESGQGFYFLLRDDVFFARVQDGHAVNSGERVGAEDAAYSMDRMRSKDCVPDHMNYNNFSAMDTVEVFTDLEALKSTASKQDGKSVFDVLQAGAPTAITALTADKAKADSAAGTYQVVHMTTAYPFPQILNVLAHSSGGIVSQKAVEELNGDYLKNPAAYDVQNDVLYGEQSWYTEGPGYNNTLVCSGPYIAIHKNDYEVVFEANPGYMPTEDKYAPKIKTIRMKFISDYENAFSALRAGEIFALYSVPTSKIDIVKADPVLEMKEVSSNSFVYCAFNFGGKMGDINLRKAVQYAVNQEELSAVFNNRYLPTYSSVTSVLETGKAFKADPEKSAHYLEEYRKSQAN